jgi:hypothetical protein
MKYLAGGIAAVVGLALCLSAPHAGEKKAPKYKIADIMQKAHKSGLLKKVQSGEASEKERKQLLEFYVALSMNKPPVGKPADWKKRTDAMVKGARAAVKDAEAGKKLKVDCMGCHDLHKSED